MKSVWERYKSDWIRTDFRYVPGGLEVIRTKETDKETIARIKREKRKELKTGRAE